MKTFRIRPIEWRPINSDRWRAETVFRKAEIRKMSRRFAIVGGPVWIGGGPDGYPSGSEHSTLADAQGTVWAWYIGRLAAALEET